MIRPRLSATNGTGSTATLYRLSDAPPFEADCIIVVAVAEPGRFASLPHRCAATFDQRVARAASGTVATDH